MDSVEMRVWDKIDKKMYYDHIGLSPCGIQIYDSSDLPSKVILDRGRDCFVLMLFTGEIDQAGTKIFKGDILQGLNGKIAVVSFSHGTYVGEIVPTGELPPIFGLRGLGWVVIGNIFETPELAV